MKLFNVHLELRALKAITRSEEAVSFHLLSQLDPEHFFSSAGKRCYQRITNLYKSRDMIPTWEDLCEDSTLSEKTRALLSDYNKAASLNQNQAESIVAQLEDFRKGRTIHAASVAALEALEAQEELDVEPIFQQLNASLEIANSNRVNFIDTRYGEGGNAMEAVKEFLNRETKDLYIPTGFEKFDSKNGGLPAEGFCVIAAPSGQGKSALTLQIGHQAARLGKRVGYYPLEMKQYELTARMMAYFSGISLTKIMKPSELSRDEKRHIYKAMKAYDQEIKDGKIVFDIKEPQNDVSIDDVFFSAKAGKYDLIIVDYITLLKGVDDSEKQWQTLGSISRRGKVFTTSNKCCLLMVAQLDDVTGGIRYAKKIKEDANLAWFLDRMPEQKNLVRVRQPKSRMQEDYTFYLEGNYGLMRFTEYDGPIPGETAGSPASPGNQKPASKKKSFTNI